MGIFWDPQFGIFNDGADLLKPKTVQEQQMLPRKKGELTTVPYGDIQGYNERSMQNEKDFAAIKDRLVMGLTPQKNEEQFKSSREFKNKPEAFVVHWTGDQFRYSGVDKNTGEKNWILDENGNKIPKPINQLINSMATRNKKGEMVPGKSVHYVMDANGNIVQTLSENLQAGHVLGAAGNPKKPKESPAITEPQKQDSFTQFPTKVSSKNALGIEVAFDPTIKGNQLSETMTNNLREFLITTMLQHNLSPKNLYAHGEIQADRGGGKGEMVEFMKDFRKNLPKYLDEYADKYGLK